MRENRSYGSVRGAARKGGPYRDRRLAPTVNNFLKARHCSILYATIKETIAAHTGKPRSETIPVGIPTEQRATLWNYIG
jgi:hypothetical protein